MTRKETVTTMEKLIRKGSLYRVELRAHVQHGSGEVSIKLDADHTKLKSRDVSQIADFFHEVAEKAKEVRS